MLPALVSLDDFALRVGGVAAADEERAQACLDDASALIRTETQTTWVDDDGALEESIPDAVVTITYAVAIRAFRNPEGVRSESIGDYSVSYADGSTAVFLTEGERRMIRRAAGRGGLGSIELESPWQPSAATVPIDIGGDEMPWVTIGDNEYLP